MSVHSVDSVLRRATPPRKQALPGILLGILSDGSVVALLALSIWLIVKSGEQPPILHLTFAFVSVRAFAIGRAAFRYSERIASHDAALSQLADLRADTFRALVPRVPGAMEASRRGEILATFVDDVDQLQDHPLRVRQPLIVSLVVTGLTVLIIGIVAPIAALVLALILGLAALIGGVLARRIAGRSDEALADARSGLTDVLLERFAAAEALSAFDALPQHRLRIQQAEARLNRVQIDRTRAAGLTGAVVSLGAGLATLVMFVIIAPSVGGSAGTGIQLTAPLFAAITVVPAAVFEVFAQIFAALTARRTVRASAVRIAKLTDEELPDEIPVDPSPVDPDDGNPFARTVAQSRDEAAPAIEVRDLVVAHPGGAIAVNGVDFTLAQGQLMLVTGESGAGKSTLALALTKFLAYRGSYRLHGVEVSGLNGTEVRSTVGLCEQRPHIFDSDLRQNLKFARPESSDDELLAVLGRVGLGEWAAARGGLDAPLGERGALMSGGQAQRISLARAILADFPVLILDEPTAGVDRELADTLLRDMVGAIPSDRAVILISHTRLPADIAASHVLQL